MASVLVKWNVQSNKLMEHNRKALAWILSLNEQREPGLSKVLDYVGGRAEMSGKLGLTQLADVYFVEKWLRHSGTPPPAKKYYCQNRLLASTKKWNQFCCTSSNAFPTGIQNKSTNRVYPQLFNSFFRHWSFLCQFWNLEPSSTHSGWSKKPSFVSLYCNALWWEGKTGEQCFHVQWRLHCCMFFLSECLSECEDTWAPSPLKQCIPSVCMCVCVLMVCAASWMGWKPTADLSSQGYTKTSVCPATSERPQACATCYWSKFNELYIS